MTSKRAKKKEVERGENILNSRVRREKEAGRRREGEGEKNALKMFAQS